ncbi:MAG: hypothetical protein OXR66_00415 [Candidatus Woesearchaeota archaeon]|nr:hypothetical protein [Candidatus Woesearchaeota archaeon]
MARLETGVDRLVHLVTKEKKVELKDAAKQLNVDPAVVQEWAEFLEEEGVVGLQFSLSKTFLVEKKLSSSEVKKKGKEYENKKEAFVRRVDAALKQLEDETAGFESIKKQYDTVKDQIGDEIEAVRDEMDQLRHYEKLKRSIDDDILKQRVEYQKTMDDIHARLSHEEKRYKKIMRDIGEEQKKIEAEQHEMADLKKEEHDLLKRVDALKDIMQSAKNNIQSQNASIKAHETRLSTLHELAEKLRADLLEKRKKEIEPMLQISDDQSSRIVRIQEDIVGKIKSSRDKMQTFEHESKAIADKFEKFFKKRARTEKTIKELDKAKHDMREEMNELIRKAKAFEITTKSADVQKHIRDMEEKFQHFERKKSAFTKQIDRLKEFILGKEEAAEQKATKPKKKKKKK